MNLLHLFRKLSSQLTSNCRVWTHKGTTHLGWRDTLSRKSLWPTWRQLNQAQTRTNSSRTWGCSSSVEGLCRNLRTNPHHPKIMIREEPASRSCRRPWPNSRIRRCSTPSPKLAKVLSTTAGPSPKQRAHLSDLLLCGPTTTHCCRILQARLRTIVWESKMSTYPKSRRVNPSSILKNPKDQNRHKQEPILMRFGRAEKMKRGKYLMIAMTTWCSRGQKTTASSTDSKERKSMKRKRLIRLCFSRTQLGGSASLNCKNSKGPSWKRMKSCRVCWKAGSCTAKSHSMKCSSNQVPFWSRKQHQVKCRDRHCWSSQHRRKSKPIMEFWLRELTKSRLRKMNHPRSSSLQKRRKQRKNPQ